MDAKEALKYFNFVVTLGRAYYPNSEAFKAHELAVEAFEKVEALEAENARLRERETPKEHGQVSWNIDRWSMHCPSCGAEIDDDSDFCKWCGQAIKNDKE